MKPVTEMTALDKKNFKPTPDMIAAAKAVFVAMAWVETVKPIVRAYQTDILNRHQWHMAKKWTDRKMKDRIILDPDQSYLLEDDDFETYHQESIAARRASGLYVVNAEYCPLLIAKRILIQAETALITIMQPVTTIDPDNVYGDLRKELIDLTLRWLAPYIK